MDPNEVEKHEGCILEEAEKWGLDPKETLEAVKEWLRRGPGKRAWEKAKSEEAKRDVIHRAVSAYRNAIIYPILGKVSGLLQGTREISRLPKADRDDVVQGTCEQLVHNWKAEWTNREQSWGVLSYARRIVRNLLGRRARKNRYKEAYAGKLSDEERTPLNPDLESKAVDGTFLDRIRNIGRILLPRKQWAAIQRSLAGEEPPEDPAERKRMEANWWHGVKRLRAAADHLVIQVRDGKLSDLSNRPVTVDGLGTEGAEWLVGVEYLLTIGSRKWPATLVQIRSEKPEPVLVFQLKESPLQMSVHESAAQKGPAK